MRRVQCVGARVALLVVVVMTVAGCDPYPWLGLPGGGGGTSAAAGPAGSWTVTSETLTEPLSTLIPGLTITASGPGITLNLKSDNTWTLEADQTLTASFDNANGTVHVTGTANGTYTSTATTTTFTVAAMSGQVTYDITALGSEFTGTVTLASSGLSDLYGLSGPATYARSSTSLSLQFHSFRMHGRD